MLKVAVARCGEVEVPLPSYQTSGSAGMDLHAALQVAVTLEPGQRQLIPTGLRLAIPEGYEAQIRPRSGLALRFGLTIVNSPGTIDSDFRGELGIVLINHGSEPFVVQPLERIAQIVFAPVLQVSLELQAELPSTVRGQGGYGSTGR